MDKRVSKSMNKNRANSSNKANKTLKKEGMKDRLKSKNKQKKTGKTSKNNRNRINVKTEKILEPKKNQLKRLLKQKMKMMI